MTTPPSTNRAAAIDTLIKALKAGGSWTKRDGIWVFWAADTQAANLNWKSTSYPYATNGTMSFTANQGYTGNGVNASGSFGISFTILTQFQRNSASAGVWSLTDGMADTFDLGFSAGGDNFRMISRNTLDSISTRINMTSTTTSSGVGTGVGYAMMNRSGATAVQTYKNGVQVDSSTVASTALNPNDLVTHCDKAANFSSRTLAIVTIGGSLTADEALAEYNALAAYMASAP